MTLRKLDGWSDVEVLNAIAEQDVAALRELYRRHEPWLTIRLRYRCADSSIVEEAVQDTFATIWRSAGRYSGSGAVPAWIWGIGIRTMLHAVRPRRSIIERLVMQPWAGVRSAEEELLLSVEHSNVGVALERLSPELRAVLQATVIDGLTCREAGRMLGIPAGTVKTRMMRARFELREALA